MPLKHTVEEVVLRNGAKGLLIDVPDATVISYEIDFRAGNDYAARSDIRQTAHILEHMAFGNNSKFSSAEAFSHEFSCNGAWSNATTSSINMTYSAECAALEWDRILDLQQLAIAQPVFTQPVLDAEKGNVREEIIGYATSHGRILWQEVMRALGLRRWYDAEELLSIDNVSLADIKEHYWRTHTLKNMRFSFSGDLKKHRQVIIDKLESWQLEPGARLAVVPDTPKQALLVHIKRPDLPNVTFIFCVLLSRELSEEEVTALSALNHMLTGTFHSRIWGKARSAGICYGIDSSAYSSETGVSCWEFGAQVSTQNAAALFELIIAELTKIRSGDISEQELDEAKLYALGRHQMRGQTVSDLNDWYTGDYFEDDTIDYLEKSPERINAVTRELIVKLADEFLASTIWTLGGIGNIERTELQIQYDQLAKLFKKG